MIIYAKKLLRDGKFAELSMLLAGLPASQRDKVEKALYD
jgi:hypothetical protein